MTHTDRRIVRLLLLMAALSFYGMLRAQIPTVTQPTHPTIQQVTVPPVSTPRLLSILPGLGFSFVALDASVTIDTTVNPPVIRATATQPSRQVTGEFYDVVTVGGIFQLVNAPIIGTLKVYRNGLRMTEGRDYALSGKTVTFTAGQMPQPAKAASCPTCADAVPADLVVFDYNF